jgi:hypothetical protein
MNGASVRCAAARWYAEHDIKPTFELVPGQYDENLGGELARIGFYQSSFHASLIGQPGANGYANDGVAIELVTTAEALEDYLEAYVAGWGDALQTCGDTLQRPDERRLRHKEFTGGSKNRSRPPVSCRS